MALHHTCRNHYAVCSPKEDRTKKHRIAVFFGAGTHTYESAGVLFKDSHRILQAYERYGAHFFESRLAASGVGSARFLYSLLIAMRNP